MPPPSKLCALTASQVASLIKNNTLTVEDYARALLGRIEDRHSTAKAWTYLDQNAVLRQARALDQIHYTQRGPLHGVAVAIKDIMNTKDMPPEYGSPFYKGNQPNTDAAAVAILRKAGALIFGKTTTTEFTVLNSGPDTTNPHDPNRTPGGSSAGSAAAVADFQVPLSVGTQTGGSVIRPASYTGAFAMKPSCNAISLEGIKLCSFTIDTFGIFARSIQDLQLVADVFSIKNDEIIAPVFLKPKVALMKTPIWPIAGPGTTTAMEKATKILENHSIEVEEIEFPPEFHDPKLLRLMNKVVVNSEARVSFLKEYHMDKTKLSPKIRGLVENVSNFTSKQVVDSLDEYTSLRPLFDQISAKFSVIITPSAVDEAPLGLDDMGDSGFNFLWTGFHMPVIHIPAFTGANGMPIGLSVVAGRFHDQHLLQICKIISEPLMADGGWKVFGDAAEVKM